MDTQTIKDMSLEDLQNLVDDLREELDNFVNVVNAQEEELTIQAQKLALLQKNIPTASASELSELKKNLVEQQENVQMLEHTLIGQYQNLHKRETLFKEYLSGLLEKQGLLDIAKDSKQLDIKLILALLEKQAKDDDNPVIANISAPAQKKWLIPVIVIALLLLGGILYKLKSNQSQSTTTEVVDPTVVEELQRPAVTALGRIEPMGEVIKLSPPPALGGTKVDRLLVKDGDRVEAGQTVAILDDYKRKQAAIEVATQEVQVSKANLAIIKAGAKTGEIQAQQATIERLEAELKSEIVAQQANISGLQAQLTRETQVQRAAIVRLKSELENAQIEFSRYQKLANDGAITLSDLDRRRTTLETAQQRVREAEGNLERISETLTQSINEAKALDRQSIDILNKQIAEARANLDRIMEVRTVDVTKAEAEVQKAIASLQQAQAELELSEIKAPTAGQILKVHAYPGEAIDTNEGIAELGQTQQMMVVAEVYESDIAKVKIGQEATMISESGAFESQLKGTVSEIGWQVGKKDVLDSDPAADVDVRVVEVNIKLDEESTKTVSNLTYGKVIVKILVE